MAYHVTQRGTNRQRVFFCASDRATYLRLLQQNLAAADAHGAAAEERGRQAAADCVHRNF
ncbi:MAG: hypothetical protein ABSH49_18300 [Bryobacteraceae bacterium]|jgi:hypothetical protein